MSPLEPLMKALEHDEEGWDDEEEGNGTHTHTADDTQGKGAVTVGTGTTLNNERYHTDDHRGHRHQNRAQALLTSLEGGIGDAQALSTALPVCR